MKNSCTLWVISTCLVVLFVGTMSYWINLFYNIKASSMTHKHLHYVEEMPLSVQESLKGIWTVLPGGGFGSFMGQYATLYALAKLNGKQAFILPTMHDKLARVFKVRLPIIPEKVSNLMTWQYFQIHDWMDPDYGKMFHDYVKFFGTTGSWTFYHHIREEILEEFSFHDFITKEVHGYLAGVKGDRKNVTYVGVHVRRGDLVYIMPKAHKGVVADGRYLQRAMEYFRKKYEEPIFVVTSDGMEWCKENINNSLGDVHFAGNGNEDFPGYDFALLAHCNHTIMTVGSFGIWAAYLTGGETIYLTNFTLPDSPLLTKFKYDATYLPEWIGIPADLSTLTPNKTL